MAKKKKETAPEADTPNVDELEELKTQVKEQAEEIAALKEINKRLNEQLAASEDAAEEGEKRTIITVGKVKYDVTGVNARYKGRKITPRVLAENPDLAETLVKIGAGYMKKVK